VSLGVLELLLGAKQFMMAVASNALGKVQLQQQLLQPAADWVQLLGDTAHLLQTSGTSVPEDLFLDIGVASEAALSLLSASVRSVSAVQPLAGEQRTELSSGGQMAQQHSLLLLYYV
jgi:hypothetical protein